MQVAFSSVRAVFAVAVCLLPLTTVSLANASVLPASAVSGTHSVGEDGSAQYSVAVNAPAGIQGMTPNISLTYNSNGGNGIAGMGFEISGLSVIHRCETSIIRDGYRDGVDFDDNDQFCLDGQRLIAVNGSYGEDGTEYRTEFDSITKIVSHGSEGTMMEGDEYPSVAHGAYNPVWFEVWTSDGRIKTYGENADERSSVQKTFVECPAGFNYLSIISSCINGSNTAPLITHNVNRTYEWRVSEEKDRFHNAIKYIYNDDDDNGEYSINRIEYNFVNGTAKNSISFSYVPRSDIAGGFFAGSVITLREILSSISTYSGTSKLRELKFTYEENSSSDTSQLSTVTECVGSYCSRPTEFQWVNELQRLSVIAKNTGNNADGWDNQPHIMDVNGDGRDDLVQERGYTWRVMLSNGDTLTPEVNTGINSAGWETAKPLRYNDDLMDDLLLAKNGKWHVLKAVPAGTSFEIINTGIDAHNPEDAKLLDLDGDGRRDLIYLKDGINRVRFLGEGGFGEEVSSNLSAQLGFKIFFADFNGDGMEDVLHETMASTFFPGTWSLYLSVGDGNFLERPLPPSFQMYYTSGVRIGDVNGDGLPDIITATTNAVGVVLNKGGDFDTPNLSGPGSWSGVLSMNASNEILSIDINADGRSDILFAKDGYWRALISTGNGFVEQNTNIPDQGWDKKPLVADVLGNGMSDLVIRKNNTWQIHPHNNTRPHYLESIENGMGVETKFSYRFLNDPSDQDFYDRGENQVYPLINIQNASYLVSKVEQSNGIGGWNSTDYRYKKLLMHQQGLGNLGFEEVTAINNDTNIQTTSRFSQDYQANKQGSLLQVTTTNLAGNTPIS